MLNKFLTKICYIITGDPGGNEIIRNRLRMKILSQLLNMHSKCQKYWPMSNLSTISGYKISM